MDVFWVWNLSRTSLDVYVFLGLGLGFGFGLQGVFICCVFGSFLPFYLLLFCQQVVWDLEDSGPLFIFYSLSPFLIGLFTLFGTPWANGGVLARDLARWLLWRLA